MRVSCHSVGQRRCSFLATLMILQTSLLLCGGCNSDNGRATVQGKVSFDGAPVDSGIITFVSKEGPTAGAEILNGEYTISGDRGPMVGENKVEISWMKKTGKQIPVGSPAPAGTMLDETKEAIPPKYNRDSTLTVQIDAGSNTHDFELTK